MKHLLPVAIICLFLYGIAVAQLPPVQSINTNAGIACNGISSQGPVSACTAGWSYGCAAAGTTNNILATDGGRTSILVQDLGVAPITLTFGDSAVYGVNGFTIQPGNSFLWSNVGRGNEPGRVPTVPISVIAAPGTTIPCVFSFTD